MSLPHEPERLQTGLYRYEGNAGAYDAEGEIEEPKEYQIFDIPLPFKGKRCHCISLSTIL